MKKQSIIIVIVALMLNIFNTGCRNVNNSPDLVDYEKMTAYAAIHSLTHQNQYDYTVKELEKDEFGRIMFAVTVSSPYDKSKSVSFVVIMQGNTKDGVLYYEDIAYYSGDQNEEKTVLLKEANDWGLPINKAKITKRRMHMEYPPGEGIYFGSTLEETGKSAPETEWYEYKKIICSALNISDADYEILISDYDEAGKWLLCVNEKTTNETKYFAVADETNVLSFIEYTDDDEVASEMISIKNASGWNYSLISK